MDDLSTKSQTECKKGTKTLVNNGACHVLESQVMIKKS
jgi:hypothetical protein